jgi:hypothetical protein
LFWFDFHESTSSSSVASFSPPVIAYIEKMINMALSW